MRIVIPILIALVSLTASCNRSREEEPVHGNSNQMAVAPMVHGVVRGPDGAPVPDAMISATSTDLPTKPVPELAVVTDANGNYEWPLRPGHYRLETHADGVGNASADVVVNPGESPVVDLNLK